LHRFSGNPWTGAIERRHPASAREDTIASPQSDTVVTHRKTDIEQYLAITWENGYSVKTPSQQATEVSVIYETIPNTVLDIHSHTGGVPAQFSPIDDHDELGLCLYAVVADMRNLCPTVELRLGIYGYFLTLSQSEVFT